ncbi:uncharacterized protein LOC112049251 [Bicyclus anynana]|uniref:Uncharacterized protein LOC112049251 n=1 Tax=Bicyclus anynana TaxID=110368 RepID=A0ABM3LQF0_BICAN|nr:uncharacterized protein LOC112049251 [Bicyclus anynana]
MGNFMSALIVNAIGATLIYGTGGLALGIVGPWLGFQGVGIMAGSLAASAQAYYGNLAAGSIISLMTAASMAAGNKIMGFLAALTVGVVGGAAIYCTGGLATGLVAPMLGFGSAGIGAGTVAASAQAYYGNLVAGSVISKLTAAAMVAPTP